MTKDPDIIRIGNELRSIRKSLEVDSTRIDNELHSIRKSLGFDSTGDTSSQPPEKSVAGRLAALEEKTVILGFEYTDLKKELTGAAFDIKGVAFEIVAAKVAWDVVSIAIPSVLKLNEEKLLSVLNLKYADTGRGFFQRLARDRPPTTSDETTTQATRGNRSTPTVSRDDNPGDSTPTPAQESRLRRFVNSLREATRAEDSTEESAGRLTATLE